MFYSPINQRIALKTIRKLHFSVSAVWNGKEALDYLLRSHSPGYIRPDVILMDVQMPVIDGYQATHVIRNIPPYSTLPELRKIPIVAMTASAIQGDREKCRTAGMDDYLPKPVKGKVLEKMLVKWVEKKKGGVGKSRSPRSYNSSLDTEPDGLTLSEIGIDASEHIQQQDTEPLKMETAASSDLPGLGLRRVETEDMAALLRDDKLLAFDTYRTSSPSNRSTMTHPSSPAVATQQFSALTEENIEKLHEQNEIINESERTPGATSLTLSGHPSTDSFGNMRSRSVPGRPLGGRRQPNSSSVTPGGAR
jgi:CheY-like chemotaxis protein